MTHRALTESLSRPGTSRGGRRARADVRAGTATATCGQEASGHGLDHRGAKSRPAGTSKDGARRIRTADLLGAIHPPYEALKMAIYRDIRNLRPSGRSRRMRGD